MRRNSPALHSAVAVTWLLAASLACAEVSLQRREYILAHPHGWVELSLADREIPDVPYEDAERHVRWERPGQCSLELALDREPFGRGGVFPVGEQAPYSAISGLRFPAAVGMHVLRVAYDGCDVQEGKRGETVLEIQLLVANDSVSEVHFDGAELRADPVRPDPVITLDDVYRAVRGAGPTP